LQILSSKIAGFLEFIPRSNFKHLQKLKYKSLYSFDYVDPDERIAESQKVRKTYFFILFGPLALCNSDDHINVSFFNFDDRDGSLLIWKSALKLSVEVTECDIEINRHCFQLVGWSQYYGRIAFSYAEYVWYLWGWEYECAEARIRPS
jgi:hypothetical protein